MLQQTALGDQLSGKTDGVYASEVPPTQARRDLSLAPDCNSDLHLFSPAEYVSLTTFVMPAIVTYLNVDISRLAHAMAKALNATLQAISAVSQERGQVREAVIGESCS